MPRNFLFCGFPCGEVCAGLDSLADGVNASNAVFSSTIAKSKSAGLNGFSSSEAVKIARARETSCGGWVLLSSDVGRGSGAGRAAVPFFGGRGSTIR